MPLNFSEPGKIVVPLTRVIVDGDKLYRQIVGFAVVDQTNVIGMYEGNMGFVTNIEDAVNIRGPAGAVIIDDDEMMTIPGDPGPPGPSAYEVWTALGNTGSPQDFINALKGADASIADVRASVAQYLVDNPPAAGKDATPEQIAASVTAWLTAHPPRDGDPGQNATDAQVATAVTTYLSANPPAPGAPGADATPEQIAASVGAYMLAHPIVVPTPADGKSVEMQMSGGFIQWRLVGNSTWTNLIATSSLVGAPGANARNIEMQKGSTAIQWRLTGDSNWIDLITIASLKGDPGAPANNLIGNVAIAQTAIVAIALGIREVTVPLAGTVVGERYQAFARSYRLNGATNATPGRPAGYTILDCACNTAGQITVSLNAPLLAIGAAYIINTDIVKVNAA